VSGQLICGSGALAPHHASGVGGFPQFAWAGGVHFRINVSTNSPAFIHFHARTDRVLFRCVSRRLQAHPRSLLQRLLLVSVSVAKKCCMYACVRACMRPITTLLLRVLGDANGSKLALSPATTAASASMCTFTVSIMHASLFLLNRLCHTICQSCDITSAQQVGSRLAHPAA
jgi:hypothetical protein